MASDLQTLWDEAEQKFEARTNKKLRAGAPKTLNDIIQEIDYRKIEAGTNAAKVKQRFKLISQRILRGIQLLGGIVAKAATPVIATILNRGPVN